MLHNPRRYHVGVRNDPNHTATSLQRTSNILQHLPYHLFTLPRIVHAEHHTHDVKATLTPAHIQRIVKAMLSDVRILPNRLPKAVICIKCSLEDSPLPPHTLVSSSRLLDTHIGGIEPDIERDILTLPFLQITTLAAPNI